MLTLDWDALRPEDLPRDLRDLYDLIREDEGHEPALAFVKRLWELAGGTRVQVPNMEAVARRQRADRIAAGLREGESPRILARKWGLSVRTVERLRQEAATSGGDSGR